MAKPPIAKENYFEKVVENVKDYFIKEGIKINFDGYKETVLQYSDLNFSDADKCFNLSRDFNEWSEYFSSLKSLAEMMYFDAETEKLQVFATASLSGDSDKVARGDRLANKDPDVVSIRKKRNELKSFITALESKISFCDKAHYHCKDVLKWLNGQNGNIIS